MHQNCRIYPNQLFIDDGCMLVDIYYYKYYRVEWQNKSTREMNDHDPFKVFGYIMYTYKTA